MTKPKAKPGKPGFAPSVDELAQTREQDRKVLELALSGLNGVQIAAEVGIDKSTVTRALQRVWARTETPKAQELRQLWDARIEAALNGIWDKVLDGDVSAVHAFCRLEERAAKLHGLDQQTVKDAGALAEALLGDPAARRARASQLRDDLAEARARREEREQDGESPTAGAGSAG